MLKIIQKIFNIFNISIIEKSLSLEKFDYTTNTVFIKQTYTPYLKTLDQYNDILVENEGRERISSIELS